MNATEYNIILAINLQHYVNPNQTLHSNIML